MVEHENVFSAPSIFQDSSKSGNQIHLPFLQYLLATSKYYMCLIGIIKLLSTVLSNAVNKSQPHQEKNSWESRESNPRLLR